MRGRGTVDDARQLLAEEDFSVVLCDIGLPGSSGLELLDELGRTRPDIATIMVTGHDHVGIVDAALKLGAYGYITKPFAANDLMIDISNALHRRRLEAERREAAESALQRAYAGTLQPAEPRGRVSRRRYRRPPRARRRVHRGHCEGARCCQRRRWSSCGSQRRCTTSARSRSGDRILRKTGMLTDDERR